MDQENKEVFEENQDIGMNDHKDKHIPNGRTDNSIGNNYFIKKAVLHNYEVAVNGIKPENPAEILEKLYPLRDDNTMTNEEKISQVRKIILEYME
jgi:hypothetical protein